MELGKPGGILFRDRLLFLKGILDVGHGKRKVCFVDVHRINPELNVPIMGQLFGLPVIGKRPGVKSQGTGMVLITGYRNPGELNGLGV